MFSFFRIFQSLFCAATFLTFKAKAQAVTVSNLAVTITSGLTATISGDFKNQSAGTIDNSGTIRVTGNWTNNASNSVFSTNAGTVQFIGTSLQNIGGTSSTSFYNLTLNNSLSAATRYALGSNLTVKNILAFTAGELNLSGYTLTLGMSAANPGSLNYSSGWMYGGTLKRWFSSSVIPDGASAGLFPIGSSSDYRPLSVSAPTSSPSTGGTISVSHTSIANTTAASFTDINVIIDRIFNSYWDITTGNGLTGGSYNLRAEGTGFTGVSSYANLRIVLAGNYVGTFGTNAGNNTNPQVNRIGLGVADLPNRFYWGFPAGSGPLPVELISFTARQKQAAVQLEWVTASEINSDFFNVERSSDGLTYSIINSQKAAGNSTVTKSYSAIDLSPISGISYYRLKETDFDGSISFSSPVAVEFKNTDLTLSIVSAIVSGRSLNLNVDSPISVGYKLDLFDDSGKLISTMNGNLGQGNQNIIMKTSPDAGGVYMVRLSTSQTSVSKKIFYNIL